MTRWWRCPPRRISPSSSETRRRSRHSSRHFCVTCCQAGIAIQTSSSRSPGKSSVIYTMRARSVQAISDWVHNNIEYRFASGRPDISAAQIIDRGYGVCRDFAHCTIALCRAINIPARYVTGHLPDIGHVDPGSPMDFHAYSEVYLGGQWHVFDARYNEPRIGRIKDRARSRCSRVRICNCLRARAHDQVRSMGLPGRSTRSLVRRSDRFIEEAGRRRGN